MVFLSFRLHRLIDLNQTDFNHYLSYIRHPVFQELVPAVHILVDNFYKEHKDYKCPNQSLALAGLAARVKGSRSFPNKRGILVSLPYFCNLF